MEKKLEWTGERMVEVPFLAKGIVEHLHRYAISQEFVKDKVVLDIACGEGYGSNLLAHSAKFVYGIDISEKAIIHAKGKYVKTNLEFKLGSVLEIPLENETIDVVVSFETLEHLLQQNEMLSELKRVLRKDGILIISTPEKANYAEVDPDNPFHLKELTYDEFKSLLSERFTFVKILKQKFTFSSQIYNESDSFDKLIEYSGSFEKVNSRNFLGGHYFNIALCSDIEDNLKIHSSIFNGNKQFGEFETLFRHGVPDKVLRQVLNSHSYKIGHFVLMPFRIIRKIFR